MPGATLAAHADWSVDPRKRWMTLALADGSAADGIRADGDRWRVRAPVPVGPVGTLLERLRHEAGGGAVVLGVDLPLGLPRAYARLHASQADFPAFLRAHSGREPFFEVAARLDEVSPARPFYPRHATKGMRQAAHARALGLDGPFAYGRLCDRATAERPAGGTLFWTVGANQTGKAAIAAWRDLVIPSLRGERPARLWPFDGDLLGLLAPGVVVMAETYPAEALRQFGWRLDGSKRRVTARAALGGALASGFAGLRATPEPDLVVDLAGGFGEDAAGEDRFDSVLGLLCVLGVLAGRRPDGIPADPWLRCWEGWVLGQNATPLEYNCRK